MDQRRLRLRQGRRAYPSLLASWTSSLTCLSLLPSQKLLFPGVGSFPQAISSLRKRGLYDPLRKYLQSGRPYFGICIGMQVLCESSEEGEPIAGLGIVPARVTRFDSSDVHKGAKKAVPHMGWSEATPHPASKQDQVNPADGPPEDLYFVHSYAIPYKQPTAELSRWAHTTTQYGNEVFVSSVRRGNILGCQFHPEKSGAAGLRVLERWLQAPIDELSGDFEADGAEEAAVEVKPRAEDGFTKRVVACLDVRTNDAGDLVVTKGDQYDVREAAVEEGSSGQVRNLGKPVDLARRYYAAGADECVACLACSQLQVSGDADRPPALALCCRPPSPQDLLPQYHVVPLVGTARSADARRRRGRGRDHLRAADRRRRHQGHGRPGRHASVRARGRRRLLPRRR